MKEIELDRELHEAYQNREFRLVYQPVFTIDRERVSAVEAFIRWDHPQRGPQLPKSFLNRLEETGLIVSVGERVLQETCQFARDLLDEGHEGIRVCVNISARQLTDPGFLLCALDALYDAGLDPSLLQLEFSEETLASIPDVARQLLPDIRKARIRVAVDHFGSGSSSLAELIRLPVSLVKIDRRLVTTITDDPVASAITSGIFALAQGTGMDVAAVGVEAATQISVLNNMGCKEIQGNFLADVLTGSELEPWLPDQDTM
jgi:EAL domain-containing protein (putative c-di-GMP-specific phosphodiesterase class I)